MPARSACVAAFERMGTVRLLVATALLALVVSAASTDINGTLCLTPPSPFQPSGLLYHTGLHRLIALADDGQLLYVDPLLNTYTFGPNIDDSYEAIAVADPSTDSIYVGITAPATIVEFDLTMSTDTRRFLLDDFGTDRMEALTFVPTNASTEGGYFYCGDVNTGGLRIYELPLKSNLQSSKERLVSTVPTFIPGEVDLSDIVFFEGTRSVFLMYGSAKLIVEVHVDAVGLPASHATAVYALQGLDDVEGLYVVRNGMNQLEFYLASSSGRILVSAQIVGDEVVPRFCLSSYVSSASQWSGASAVVLASLAIAVVLAAMP